MYKRQVQERINYADTDHAKWTVEPTYTVTVAHKTMDENEMADAILKSASDEISEGMVGEIIEASARCIPIYHYDGPITLTITRDGKDPNRWSWHI